MTIRVRCKTLTSLPRHIRRSYASVCELKFGFDTVGSKISRNMFCVAQTAFPCGSWQHTERQLATHRSYQHRQKKATYGSASCVLMWALQMVCARHVLYDRLPTIRVLRRRRKAVICKDCCQQLQSDVAQTHCPATVTHVRFARH
jgi:hypothetical protein